MITMAATEPTVGVDHGISDLIFDEDPPGFIIEREIPMIGSVRAFELISVDSWFKDSRALEMMYQRARKHSAKN